MPSPPPLLGRASSPSLSLAAPITTPRSSNLKKLRSSIDLKDRFGGKWDMAEGLLVWRYLGGPWEAVDKITFEGKSTLDV